MKKIITILIVAFLSQISKAQKIYIYGEINESHVDSLNEYLNAVFLNNNKLKKIKIYCTSYQSNDLKNCEPLIVSKKKFRTEIISYYSSTIENKNIKFEFDKLNQIKNELITTNENVELQILDKCESVRGRSSDKVNISNTLGTGNEFKPEFIDVFGNKNAIVLLSFYSPSVNLTNFRLDNTNIQFIDNSSTTFSMKKEVVLTGMVVGIQCKIKSLVIKQAGLTTNIPTVYPNFTHPIVLKKGINEISLIITYANNIKITNIIKIEFLGDEKINFLTPAESGEVMEICQSNDGNAFKQIQIQFETRISPNLLNLNIKRVNDINNIETKSISLSLSNYDIEDITSNESDKIRKYCFYLDARDIFNQLVSTKGYGACLWPTETSYSLYFSMVDSAIRASKELNGIIIMDAGDEGAIKRPMCRACN